MTEIRPSGFNAITALNDLAKITVWLKVFAMALLINAVLDVLVSTWALLVVWLPLWMGILLWQAAQMLEDFRTAGDLQAGSESVAKLALYFKIFAITILVGIILVVGSVILAVVVFIP